MEPPHLPPPPGVGPSEGTCSQLQTKGEPFGQCSHFQGGRGGVTGDRRDFSPRSCEGPLQWTPGPPGRAGAPGRKALPARWETLELRAPGGGPGSPGPQQDGGVPLSRRTRAGAQREGAALPEGARPAPEHRPCSPLARGRRCKCERGSGRATPPSPSRPSAPSRPARQPSPVSASGSGSGRGSGPSPAVGPPLVL